MTSNIAGSVIQELPESERERMKSLVMAELKHHFRPEFLNRVDEALIFHKLDERHMERIVRIQLDRFNELLAQQGLRVEASDDALRLLARHGFDPDFGARPLKRAIQHLVQDPLANLVLAGEVGPDQTVRLEVEGDELRLVPSAEPVTEPATTAQ
jgi:ATP-dependent Clp protease ATP-binding subunit ClpB